MEQVIRLIEENVFRRDIYNIAILLNFSGSEQEKASKKMGHFLKILKKKGYFGPNYTEFLDLIGDDLCGKRKLLAVNYVPSEETPKMEKEDQLVKLDQLIAEKRKLLAEIDELLAEKKRKFLEDIDRKLEKKIDQVVPFPKNDYVFRLKLEAYLTTKDWAEITRAFSIPYETAEKLMKETLPGQAILSYLDDQGIINNSVGYSKFFEMIVFLTCYSTVINIYRQS